MNFRHAKLEAEESSRLDFPRSRLVSPRVRRNKYVLSCASVSHLATSQPSHFLVPQRSNQLVSMPLRCTVSQIFQSTEG